MAVLVPNRALTPAGLPSRGHSLCAIPVSGAGDNALRLDIRASTWGVRQRYRRCSVSCVLASSANLESTALSRLCGCTGLEIVSAGDAMGIGAFITKLM